VKDKIQAVLERELDKFNRRSLSDPDTPLDSRDVRSLDLLIRAYRSFVDPADKPASPPPASPETAPTSALLDLSDTPASENAE
jgi:hypothetical protein